MPPKKLNPNLIRTRDAVQCPVCKRKYGQLFNIKSHIHTQHNYFLKDFLPHHIEEIPQNDVNKSWKFLYHKIKSNTDISELVDLYHIQVQEKKRNSNRKISEYFPAQPIASSTTSDAALVTAPVTSKNDNYIDPVEEEITNSDLVGRIEDNGSYHLSTNYSEQVRNTSQVVTVEEEDQIKEDLHVDTTTTSNPVGVGENAQVTHHIDKQVTEPSRRKEVPKDYKNINISSEPDTVRDTDRNIQSRVIWNDILQRYQNCKVCKAICNQNNSHDIYLRSNFTQCSHLNQPCCCTKLKTTSFIKPLLPEVQLDPNINHKIFYYKENSLGEYRLHCHICVRYGLKESSHIMLDGGDYIINGVNFEGRDSYKKMYLERHLNSNQHKLSVSKQATEERRNILSEKPTPDERERATENLCRAVQYLVDQGHSYRELAILCAFISKIIPDGEMNPLGNQQQSTKNYCDFLISNEQAIKESLRKEMNIVNPMTKQTKRFSVSLDKGTCKGDATRQAVVATSIDYDKGESREILLSANRIFDKSANGCLTHLIKSCDNIIEPKNIVSTCTDSENVYSGDIAGLNSLIPDDAHFDDRILVLLDLCHRLELNLGNDKPLWLKDTLEKSGNISKYFEPRSILSQHFYNYGNKDPHLNFTAIAKMSETRYIEFAHHHIESIIRNIEI